MKINGYKVKFKDWFSIVILKKTLTLNYLIKIKLGQITNTRLIVMLTRANIPEEAIIITDVNINSGVQRIRAIWSPTSDLSADIMEGAAMNGYKAVALKDMIDENNS